MLFRSALAADRARKHRDAMRHAGLRSIQLWVADTRGAGFGAECRRQCLLVRERPVRPRRCRHRPRINLRRGDLVTLVSSRRSGKPGRPQQALVMPCDQFAALLHVTVLLIAREPRAAPLLRIPIPEVRAQIMIDSLQAMPRTNIRMVYEIGRAHV